MEMVYRSVWIVCLLSLLAYLGFIGLVQYAAVHVAVGIVIDPIKDHCVKYLKE